MNCFVLISVCFPLIALRKLPSPPPRRGKTWVFRDVVFQDVGFKNNSFKPLANISYRCEVPTPSVVEGQSTIIVKPHILKHHILELPKDLPAVSPAAVAFLCLDGCAAPGGQRVVSMARFAFGAV